MKFWGKDETHVKIECEKCKKVYKFDNKYFDKITETSCTPNTLIKCPSCGSSTTDTIHSDHPISITTSKAAPDVHKPSRPSEVKCPRCGSTQITAFNKGFGLGKAAVGAIALGPVGLLGGLIGSKDVMVACLHCGHKWRVG